MAREVRRRFPALPIGQAEDPEAPTDLLTGKARTLFPGGRRALMYTPMEVRDKTSAQLRVDLEQIARQYGPCDLVFADIESGTPDQRVLDLARMCEEISAANEA